ncbi:MAG: isoprenylcysteine carboxylmethyltransferase family protein [Chloroflexi bacterium]|nr:isoprenylcysteine carboxylmethyltransferase family protein [Chloroflexota bacterium]
MNTTTATPELIRTVLGRIIFFFAIIALVFFLPAGTWKFWQAWMWLITMILLMLITLRYLLKNDPALLERRMRMRERQQQQWVVLGFSFVFLMLSFILPGFDQRYGWSNMPAWVALLGDGIVIAGYLLVLLVFKTNTYTSRIVEVEAGQQVISSGPYAIVRHPMYVGAVLTYAFTPLALGSYWAFIPGLMILPVLIFRIINEEKLLLNELDGYREYTQKVKYRLLPGVW